MHEARIRRHGSPDVVLNVLGRAAEERLILYAAPPDANGCVVWTRSTVGGYGSICVDGKTEYVHRVAYRLRHGPIPDGMDVLHHCDNPPCFTDEHLFLGTNAENIADRIAKGRSPFRKGSANPRAKLTERDVVAMRRQWRGGANVREVAENYEVSEATARFAISGRTWSHVPMT